MVADEHKYDLPEFLTGRWQEISTEYFALVYQQSEKRLLETIKTAESFTTRGYILLGFVISFSSVVVGYLFSYSLTDPDRQLYVLTAFISIPFLIGVFYNLYRILVLYGIEVPGSEPKFLLLEGFIDGFDDKEQLKNMYLCECKSNQERINHNHSINRVRSKNFMWALQLLVATPTSFGFAWILLRIL